MSFDYKNKEIQQHMFEGLFGVEKESLRVDENGCLPHTPHPFKDNKNIDRDFCENQTEFITDAFESVDEVCSHLRKLHVYAYRKLDALNSAQEYFWPFSNPPHVRGEFDISVANYTGSLANKSIYRKYLAEKYGKMKMLYSGVHFNFNFSDKLVNIAFSASGEESYFTYKSQLYLEFAKKITKYSWFIVYLTASSPVFDSSFFNEKNTGETVVSKYSSGRCSEIGYWNKFVPVLDYSDITSYIKSIERYVDEGMLKSASELYYPVRLKPKGNNSIENLKTNGINHIELRMLDLNPFSPTGVNTMDIKFLHLLIVYLMSLDDEEFTEAEQTSAIFNMKNAALIDDDTTYLKIDDELIPLRVAAERVMNNIIEFYTEYNDEDINDVIGYQKEKIDNPDKRYANMIMDKFGRNYVAGGMEISKQHYSELIEGEM